MNPEAFYGSAGTYAEQRQALARELHSRGLGAYVDYLKSLARPAALFMPTPTPDAEIDVGRSKIGGWPDLPADLDWPTADVVTFRSWNDFRVTGTYSIPFLLQIDLAGLADIELDIDLPRTGLLSVFHGADHHEVYGDRYEGVRPGWRVLHFEDGVTLTQRSAIARAAHRSVADGPEVTFLPQLLQSRQITTLPYLFDAFPLGAGTLADADFDAMNEFEVEIDWTQNAVRLGGHARATGNGEPLSLTTPRRLHQEGDGDTYRTLEEVRAEGWRHLLTMSSREYWDEFPDQGELHVDYVNPTFGGDGVMGIYVRPTGNDWLSDAVLSHALAGVRR